MGGLVAAPLTLGVSLISAVGGGVCAVGGATAAGAEYFISKKKVAGIQEVFEEDNKLAKEIQVLWESIFSKCDYTRKKHSSLKYSTEEVFQILLVCCTEIIPGKWASERCRRICKIDEKKVRGITATKQRGAHAFDVVHCEKMVGVSAKIVKAAKLLRFATGVSPLSVIGCGLGFGIDIASLAFCSYQIHKRSDSSAGKELIKKQEELEKGKQQLIQIKDCLSDLFSNH